MRKTQICESAKLRTKPPVDDFQEKFGPEAKPDMFISQPYSAQPGKRRDSAKFMYLDAYGLDSVQEKPRAESAQAVETKSKFEVVKPDNFAKTMHLKFA